MDLQTTDSYSEINGSLEISLGNLSQLEIWPDNSTANPAPPQFCQTAGDCLQIFLIPVISVFGIIGNAFSFKVFVCTSFGRHTSSIYLAALSISDTGFLLALFFSWLGSGELGLTLSHSLVFCHFVVYVTYVCGFLSVWYVVLIMIDRYIVVCHPLKIQTLCSRKRCFSSVLIVTLFAFLFYSQTFFTSVVRNNQCTIAEEYIGLVVIFTYIDTVATFIFPIITVFILNVVVIVSIKRFRKRQIMIYFQEDQKPPPPKSTLSTAQVRITSLLVVVSTVFLVTNLPSHAIRLYIMIYRILEYKKHHEVIAQAQKICNLLYFCNFAINFLLYSSSSKIFRKFLCLNNSYGLSSCKSDERNKYFNGEKKGNYVLLYMKRKT